MGYKEFYTEEIDGKLFPGLNTAGYPKLSPHQSIITIASTHEFSSPRAANNFPAGGGQIVRSNLFLLGHIPFLAGQTSIITLNLQIFS